MSDDWKDPRWQKKRLQIFERDGWKCVACGDSEATLCVHHCAYEGKPWDVDDALLQTLCESCHHYLGEHPKGGVYWERDDPELPAAVAVYWCPLCKRNSFKDKGTYFKCKACGWRTCYDHLNFHGNIEAPSTIATEPSDIKPSASTGFVTAICDKLRSAGVTNTELFRAAFNDVQVPDCIAQLDDAFALSRRLKTGHDLSDDDERALLEALVEARRAMQQEKPKHRATLGRRRSAAK